MSRLTISFPIVSFAARWLTVNMPDCHELVLVQSGYRSRSYLFDGESVTSHEEHKCRQMMVPPVGLEPTRSREHRILSPARLPIPPQGQAAGEPANRKEPLAAQVARCK
jgi:hypothetical protein